MLIFSDKIRNGVLKMSIIKRIAAVLLVAVMALSLTGCGDTTWIMKADDLVINSGLYIYYQTQGYVEAVYTLAAEDINYYYYYMYGYSLVDEAFDDTQTVGDYMNTYAIDMCKQYVVIEQLFNELGLELSEDEISLIKAQTNSTWANSSADLENIGISKSTLEMAITASLKEELVFNAYYEVGGLAGTTEETIQAHFEDEYARIKYMTFNFVESIDDAIDETVKNEQLALAQSYLDRANAGEDFDALIEEYNAYLESIAPAEEETAEEAEETSDEVADDTDETAEEDEAVEAEADEYENESIISVDSTLPTEKFVGYVFNNCKVNEYSLIQDDTNFYLVHRLDILERDDIYDENRLYLLSELYDSDYTALINETLADYDIVINEKSVKRYTAQNAIEGKDAE